MVRAPPYVRNKTPSRRPPLGSGHATCRDTILNRAHCRSGSRSLLGAVLPWFELFAADWWANICFLCRLSGRVAINPTGQDHRAFRIMILSPPHFLNISLHFASTFHSSGQYLLLTSNCAPLRFAVLLQRVQDTAVLGDQKGRNKVFKTEVTDRRNSEWLKLTQWMLGQQYGVWNTESK